eukprot:3848893-Pleurochrysis_carterae.AAC.2
MPVRRRELTLPETGLHKMPQQLCPADMYAPAIGIASGGHGRMHACTVSGTGLPSDLDISLNAWHAKWLDVMASSFKTPSTCLCACMAGICAERCTCRNF